MQNILLAFRCWVRLIFSATNKNNQQWFFNRLSNWWLSEHEPTNQSCVCNWQTPGYWEYWEYVKDGNDECKWMFVEHSQEYYPDYD